MINQLTTNIIAKSGTVSVQDSLNLLQEPVPVSLTSPSFQDFSAMLGFARSGLSAKFYEKDDCPAEMIDGWLHISLAVLVFPSRMDLEYTPTLSGGEVHEKEEVLHPVEFDALCTLSESIDLDYLISDLQLNREIPCYSERSRILPAPSWRLEGSKVVFNSSHFSLYRIKGLAKGFSHPVTVKVEVKEGYKTEDIQAKFQVTWKQDGELQQKSMELTIPECVAAYLNTCEDGDKRDPLLSDSGKRPKVFFSGCTGKVLKVIPRNKADGES